MVIADDHALIRDAFRRLLESTGRITVIGEAGHGEEAIAAITALAPDVALVDVNMPRANGIEVARRVAASAPRTRVLAVTMHEEVDTIRALLEAGAAGYLPKSATGSDLIAAVFAVAQGEYYVHRSVVGDLLRCGFHAQEGRPAALSERERDVLRHIANGYANKEIAAALKVSVKTVETYRARAAHKIGARSRVDIVAYAAAQGWIASPAATLGPARERSA